MKEQIARVFVCMLLMLGVLAAGGCSRGAAPEPGAGTPSAAQPGTPPPAAAYIMTGDLRMKPQLLSGWNSIEDGAWRWMGKQADAVLAIPANPSLTFELSLFFPGDHMQKAGGPVTATVLFDGRPFAEETYTIPGPYTLSKPVPAGLLNPPSVKVTIQLSRAVAPSAIDHRELGAVVSRFGLR